MNIELGNTISAADTRIQYDEKAKQLLSNKIILAHILIKTVNEFQGMNLKEVVSYIEGDSFISVVPLEPGLTNTATEKNGQRIVGLNTENEEINVGLIRFDCLEGSIISIYHIFDIIIADLEQAFFRAFSINDYFVGYQIHLLMQSII